MSTAHSHGSESTELSEGAPIMYMDGFGGGFMFDIFPVIFTIVFVLVFGVILAVVIKGIVQWNRNNHSPVLHVRAVVVTKRISVSRHMHSGADHHAMHHTSTRYYATFQVESGDRMELSLSGQEYGMLAEGDTGILVFQGTRYKSFTRQ